MGDMVQRVMEEMVPELEDLQRKGILNKVSAAERCERGTLLQ